MFRHVFVMASAVKMMGWKFHNSGWHIDWRSFVKECNEVYESDGYDKETREEMGLYLSL